VHTEHAAGEVPEQLPLEQLPVGELPVEQEAVVAPAVRETAQPTQEPSESASAQASVEAPVAILDLPVQKSQRTQRRISTKDAEQILDSVLDALPEPKQPGQGRARVSRRASSTGGAIITTEASPE
ncbi:MAG: ribonuclease, partial [Glaciihabitans sp.]|nr:ribonuclease [Glaciihabitans sp.]